MRANLQAGLLLVVALAIPACAGLASSSGDTAGAGGKNGGTGVGGSVGSATGGASGVHCTTTACVPALSTHLIWDVELTPPSTSGAALTELIDVDLAAATLSCEADVSDTLTTTFTVPANATAPSSANVVLTTPSSIPGRPDLTFQAPAVVATALIAAVTVPSLLLDRAATVALIPLPPADQQSPPYLFSAPLASTVQVSLPTDNLSISGTLLTAFGTPPAASSTFVGRAFQNGTQVSNAPLTAQSGGTQSTGTQSAGSFQLLLPSAVMTNGAPLTIQLTPQSQTDPWYVSNPIASPFPTMLGTIVLPAYTTPNQFTVVVDGPGGAIAPVSGMLVQVQAVIGQVQAVMGSSTAGSVDFGRSGLTDATGTVSLSLLPGSVPAPLDYSIVVIPPANSPYATQCFPAARANASAPKLATITLTNRPIVSGTVTDSHGYPVANVNITATPGATPICGSTPPSAGNTTTAADGTFSLPLDPGTTYQLDYDPPSGAAVPRLTDPAFAVAAAPLITHNVALPAGALVVGTVLANDKTTPLPSTTVRLYEPRCSGSDCTGPMRTPPWLRGQTVTDANGQFRVVVPLPD
jgi:hypothetical protein